MEKALSPVLDALPGMVWAALPDGRVDFFNQHWCEYTGLSVDELLEMGWQAATHPEDLPDLLERWRTILSAGEASAMEARLRRFDGTYHWFNFRIRPLIDASGKPVRWCGLNIDVEDGRRHEEIQRAREDHYRSTTDRIPDQITFMIPAEEVESVNRPVLEYFDATLEVVKGWTTNDIVHPDDRSFVVAAWKRAVETGEPYDTEHRMRRADGSYRWFHARALPIRDTQGDVSRWYVLQTDIDRRKQAEALLAGEKRLLELVASGETISQILEALCRLVENTADRCYCSIVLVDPSGTKLQEAIAPSLPAEFNDAVRGWPLDRRGGPCVIAARDKIQVIMSDVASDTRWQNGWRELAQMHGLKSCWSTPIVSLAGKVLGTFALYYDEPRSPTSEHRSLIELFANIASIAIEHAQSDAALKLSEARKTAILDSALDCIITMDHEGCVTEFNPAAERTFGYCRDEVLGKQLADLIVPPSQRGMHRQGLTRYLATGEARMLGRRVELMAARADGSEFPVEIAISRIPLEGPPSFTGYLRDITERKQSEEKLRRSEASLAEAQHLSSTGSFFWSFVTGEFTWSEQLYRIFEFEQGIPITFELIRSRYHPEDIPVLEDVIEQTKRAVSDFDYEHRLLMPDQSVKYVRVVAHGARDKDGRLEYVGAVQDVTESRRSDAALGKARSELTHMSKITSLGVLTASIAHEVNQPLSGIITNASTCLRMLAADPPNVDGALETARRTIRDGNRASDVITRLRALFGNKDLATDLVDLTTATREVIALSLTDLQRSRVILRTELADDLPLVTGDRVQIQQVILNLIRNASDAMNDVDDRPRQLVVRTERDEDDHVRLTVQDAGMGFKSQDTDRFFEPFYTTKSDGMGIGLSVSRSIIEKHHGRLWATPNEGPGATFAFSVPCRTDAQSLDVSQMNAATQAQHVERNS